MMSEAELYHWLLWSWIGLAVCVFVALQWISAPYGRHQRKGWGPSLSQRSAWVLMETPTLITFLLCVAWGDRASNGPALAFLVMWLVHYGYRSLIYPFRVRGSGKTMPIAVVAMAAFFTAVNGYLNGRWINTIGPELTNAWFLDWRFLLGTTLFVVGLIINHQSDGILRRLRTPGETGYKVPVGGLYKYVSCPNYLGEILEWIGWAFATWSPAGLAFAVWTVANLAPRARSHHDWYKASFEDYPKDRKVLVPFVW